MRVDYHVREQGTRRTRVDTHWFKWALPLGVSLSRNWYPTADAAITQFPKGWLSQVALNVTVLALTFRVILKGPLFTAEEVE